MQNLEMTTKKPLIKNIIPIPLNLLIFSSKNKVINTK